MKERERERAPFHARSKGRFSEYTDYFSQRQRGVDAKCTTTPAAELHSVLIDPLILIDGSIYCRFQAIKKPLLRRRLSVVSIDPQK